jgi:DNA-binding LytR/AlgR family response regulator
MNTANANGMDAKRMDSKPTAIIVDDEPLLRAQVRDTLAAVWPELTILAEAGHADAARQAIAAHNPDFVFLDIEMPGESGLDLAATLKGRAHVVFVTAYDQYALKAFERGAVDYILKPASPARLQDTVARLKARTQAPTAAPDLAQLMQELRASLKPQSPERLTMLQVSLGNQTRLIAVTEVLFFQSDTKYTRVVTKEIDALVRAPLKDLLAQLDPTQFWQIHRATVVNVQAIDRVERDELGHQTVHLKHHAETLEVSRSYGHLFRQAL